jgi:hypothetical protein
MSLKKLGNVHAMSPAGDVAEKEKTLLAINSGCLYLHRGPPYDAVMLRHETSHFTVKTFSH